MALSLRRPVNASRLNATFQALFDSPKDETAGALLGLEHEYRVWRAGRLLDFRSLIHQLPIRGRRIDVADPNAYRCDWGGSLTCDGAEAEVATPPIAQEPSFTRAIDEADIFGRRELEAVLPAGTELEGYSTHLSASMPQALNDSAALLYAQVFAPALMLLMDRSDSPGLLIRPRPGRLELCGEFASGASLRAAAAFVAGSVRACAAALTAGPDAVATLPPAVTVELAPAKERFGWFVDRQAFGPDLYADGRAATLTLTGGGSITGQDHLEAAYKAVRYSLAGHASNEDLRDLEEMVTGRMPLPSEIASRADDELSSYETTAEELEDRNAWSRALGTVQRPTFRVSGERLSWDFAVFRISGNGKSAFASIPRASLDRFLTLLALGQLDQLMERFLVVSGQGVTLENHSMTTSPGLFRAISKTASLASPERLPFGAVGGPWERPGKRRQDDDEHDDHDADHQDSSQTQNAASHVSSAVTSVGRQAARPRHLAFAVAAAVGAVVLVAAMAAAGLIPGIGPTAAPAATPGNPGVGLLQGDGTPSAAVPASVEPSAQTPTPSNTPSPAPTPAPTPVDLSGVDACALLDEQAVQELTGTSLEFATDGSGADCFWGATTPVPQYVQLDVFRNDGACCYTFSPGEGCSLETDGFPVPGVGTEAVGATCPEHQNKVYLIAWDRGVAILLLVNEPNRPLDPEDLGPTIAELLAKIVGPTSAAATPIQNVTSPSVAPSGQAFVDAQTIPCEEIISGEEVQAEFAYDYSAPNSELDDILSVSLGESSCSYAIHWKNGGDGGDHLILVDVLTGIPDDYWASPTGAVPVPDFHEGAISLTELEDNIFTEPSSIYHLLVPVQPGLGVRIRVPVPMPGQPLNPEEGAQAVAQLVMDRLAVRFPE